MEKKRKYQDMTTEELIAEIAAQAERAEKAQKEADERIAKEVERAEKEEKARKEAEERAAKEAERADALLKETEVLKTTISVEKMMIHFRNSSFLEDAKGGRNKKRRT